MNTTHHHEILAAWQAYAHNPEDRHPCQNFIDGFRAGRSGTVRVSSPPEDGDTITIGHQTFVFREITLACQREADAEARHQRKLADLAAMQPLVMNIMPGTFESVADLASHIESGFDDPKQTAPEIQDGLPRECPLCGTCHPGAACARTGPPPKIPNLADQFPLAAANLKAMKAMIADLSRKIADLKNANTVLQARETALMDGNAALADKLARREKQLIDDGWQKCPGPAGLKAPIGNRAYWKKQAEDWKQRAIKAELAVQNKNAVPSPQPWTLSDLAHLITMKKTNLITSGDFFETLNSRPMPFSA